MSDSANRVARRYLEAARVRRPAAEAYQEHYNAIKAHMKALERKLDTHSREFMRENDRIVQREVQRTGKPPTAIIKGSWPYVGDVEHWREKLEEILG